MSSPFAFCRHSLRERAILSRSERATLRLANALCMIYDAAIALPVRILFGPQRVVFDPSTSDWRVP
jgi:hypothetical protein